MPATVEEYYPDTQTVDVQPVLKSTLITPPSTVKRPKLLGIPIIFPKSSGNTIHIPLKKGDGVGLIFCQRSLDDWKTVGGLTSVQDVRLHDLTDAVAIAGLDITPRTIPEPDKMSILASEGLWIGNPEGTGAPAASVNESELLQALEALTKAIYEVPLISAMGAVNFDPSVVLKFQALEALFKEIGGN